MSRPAHTAGVIRRTIVSHFSRFVSFGLVGVSGVLINSALLYLLVSHAGWSHVPAAAFATEVSIITNFTLNDSWTFRDIPHSTRWSTRLLRYNTVALGGMALSLGVLALLTLGAGMHYLLANLVGIAVGTLWNYGINALYTWNIRETGAQPSLMEFVATPEG